MKVGFIGAGNIAGAIIGGVVTSGLLTTEEIGIYDVSEKVQETYREQGFVVATDLNALFSCDILFLTVKPQYYEEVLSAMWSVQGKIIVTVAPGISIKWVRSFLDASNKVIRTMPNTPLTVGEGMTLLSRDESVSLAEFLQVKSLFEPAGKTKEIPEALMDAGVGLTGSSPAYVYMLIEALADGAVYRGMDRASAIEMAAQAVYGTAKMVLTTGEHPAKLKDMVCSPGGTTIRAVKELEDNGFRSSILKAMEACYQRSIELGK